MIATSTNKQAIKKKSLFGISDIRGRRGRISEEDNTGDHQ